MKRYLPFLSFALIVTLVFSACTSTPKTDELAAAALKEQATASQNPDTIGLSKFYAWRAQNELVDEQDLNKPAQYAAPIKTAKNVYHAPVHKASKPVVQPTPPPPAPAPTTTNTSTNTTTADSDNSGTINSESSETAKAPVKKGISKAAKGAVIGGVVGAVGGAIINKDNRVVGAVIGGVIGAGGGYGIGRGMDKKDGRIEMIQN